jgi:serine/threonine-protein kinase
MRGSFTIKEFDDKIKLVLAGNLDVVGESLVQDCIPQGVLDGVLGIGGQKLVLSYTDSILKMKRVLNIRLPSLTSNGEQRFLRGARILNRIVYSELSQGRVPPFPIVFDIRDFPPFYVSQLIHGVTLKEYIEQQGSLSLEDRLVLFKRIADGVSLLHKSGTVHRDLKPENVMVDAGGNPKILDFGIAISTYDNPLTRTDAQLGTPGYAAPEQLTDAGSVDHRADIYSLGKVLYFIVTGNENFASEDIPLELMMIIPKVWEDDPDRRPATVSAFVEEVAEAYPDMDFQSERYAVQTDCNVAQAFINLLVLYSGNPGKIKQILDLTMGEFESLMKMAKLQRLKGG